MTLYHRLLLQIIVSLLAFFSTYQLQAQLGTGNYPCMPQNRNTPPELFINDIAINGQSVYGLSHYSVTPGATYLVEMYFTAAGGSTNTNNVYAKVHMDLNLNGNYDAGEMIASPLVPPTANSGYVQFPMTIPAATTGDPSIAFVMDFDEVVAQAPPCSGILSYVGAYGQVHAVTVNYNQLLAVASDPDPQTTYAGILPTMPEGAMCINQNSCVCFSSNQSNQVIIGVDMSDLDPHYPYRVKIGLKEDELILSSPSSGTYPSKEVKFINYSYSNANPCKPPVGNKLPKIVSAPHAWDNIVNFVVDLGFLTSELPHNIDPTWGSSVSNPPAIPPYLRMSVELDFQDNNGVWRPVGLVPQGQSLNQGNANPNFELNLWYCFDENLECGDEESSGRLGQDNPDTHIANEFAIYPNPSNGLFHIDYHLTKKSMITVNVVDFQGKMVMSVNKGTQLEGQYQDQIDLSGLPKGIYLLQHISQDGVKVERIFKE